MIERDDWRLLRGQEDYLMDRRIMRISCFRWSEAWDHEHCQFCWAKLSEAVDDLHEGYVTADDKKSWICPECFEDFKEMFQWELVDAESSEKIQ